jgi:ketosteroid isomerase-like protein
LENGKKSQNAPTQTQGLEHPAPFGYKSGPRADLSHAPLSEQGPNLAVWERRILAIIRQLSFREEAHAMKRYVLATFLTLLFSSAPFPQDKSTNGDEIQIMQLERAWNQAEAKQEVHEVSSLLADTLVYTDYDGAFMNKSEYMKWVVAPQQKADHIYDEGLSVQVYGDAAVATGIYRETGTNKGKPYVVRSRFTDTWIKRKGVWLCVASQSTIIPAK